MGSDEPTLPHAPEEVEPSIDMTQHGFWAGKEPNENDRMDYLREMLKARNTLDCLLAQGEEEKGSGTPGTQQVQERIHNAALNWRDGPEEIVGSMKRVFASSNGEALWSEGITIPLITVPLADLDSLMLPSPEAPQVTSYDEEDLGKLTIRLEDLEGKEMRDVAWRKEEEMVKEVRVAIQKLDRVLPLHQAMDLAGKVVRNALFCHDKSAQIAKSTFRHAFKMPVGLGEDIIQTDFKRAVIRVGLGVRRWRTGYFGLGMEVEASRIMKIVRCSGGNQDDQEILRVLAVCRFSKCLESEREGGEERMHEAEEEEFKDVEDALPVLEPNYGEVTFKIRWDTKREESDESSTQQEGEEEEEKEVQGGTGRDLQEKVFMSAKEVIVKPRPLMAQMYAWGENASGCLGLNDDEIRIEPQLSPLNFTLPCIERVVSIAVSGRHSVVATVLGSVYTAGEGLDGALGQGDLQNLSSFRLVEWFSKQDPIPMVARVFAGSDTVGSHTAALDNQGKLYMWGYGPATGVISLKPVQSPQLVKALEDQDIAEVACGGGFTLARTKGGRVFSWGLWAHGRVGLGAPDVQYDRYNRKRTSKYCLKPRLVKGRLEGRRVTGIAAGCGHGLALTEGGKVFAWGRDDYGQLGVELKFRAPFASVFEPEEVEGLEKGGINEIVKVECGSYHSLAISKGGELWSWGAAGGACLGHGDLISWENKVNNAEKLLKKGKDGQTPVMNVKPAWGYPRKIRSLEGVVICSVSGGSHHSAGVTDDGRLFVWGEGLSALKPREEEGQEEEEDKVEGEEEEGEEEVKRIEGIEIPRQPCATWLPRLAGKWTEQVTCGGHSTIVITSGEQISMTLGRDLYQVIARAGSGLDDKSIDSGMSYLTADAVGSGSSYDCALLVSGRVLPAHKWVLARRSITFKELIAVEEWPGDGAVMELILPDLRYDVARALLQFIYCDNLFFPLDFRTSLPYELLIAAQDYELPRLEELCRSAIAVEEEEEEKERGGSLRERLRKIQSTAPTDFGGGLGAAAWADLRFIAEGRPLLAHRLILMTRSEYFRAMFRSGMREGSVSSLGSAGIGGKASEYIDIVVPDTYESMTRLLLYIYTGNLADRNNETLLEDLMAADRYQLLGMKELCESLIEVERDNVLEVLRVASLVKLPRLKQAAMLYFVKNLTSILCTEEYREFVGFHPSIMAEIFEMMKAGSNLTYTLDEDLVEGGKEKKEEEKLGEDSIPWMQVLFLIILGLVYHILSNIIALGWLVPVINITVTAVLLSSFFWKTDGKKKKMEEVKEVKEVKSETKNGAMFIDL